MKKYSLPSHRASADLVKLGEDIAIARKRRRITQQRLAEGAGVSVATLRRLERGDHGVSMGVLAMTLLALGESGRLGGLMDIAKDDIGLLIAINELPKRVRGKRGAKTAQANPNTGMENSATNFETSTLEVW